MCDPVDSILEAKDLQYTDIDQIKGLTCQRRRKKTLRETHLSISRQ